MNVKNILWNLAIIIAGPIITFGMEVADGKKIDLTFLPFIGIGVAIALAVSLVINSIIKKELKKTVIISIIISEGIYYLILIITSLHSPRDLMWLPIALIFLPFISLPTALSVCYGTSKIFRAWKDRNGIAS